MANKIKGYSKTKLKQDKMDYEITSTVLIYYPVYVITLSYNNNKYSFYMNGQTGKICGETPISIPKVILACILYWVVAITLLILLFYILYL